MEVMIEGVTMKYSEDAVALSDVHLKIGHGVFGLLGPNGAGKTTLMQILATLLKPSSGHVRIGDYVLGRDNKDIRRRIGYLPQTFGLYPNLTAKEFLTYMALNKGMRHAQERKREISRLLDMFNLSSGHGKKIKKFSGGMKQRLGIAQALLGDPDVIIVDEPTVGLDPEERWKFRNYMADISTNKTVILSTHIVGDIEDACSHLALLDKGDVVYSGEPGELLHTYEGKVWTGIVTLQQLQDLPREQVINRKRGEGERFEIRMIAEEKPFEQAQPVLPNLEDVYMLSQRERR